MDITVADRVKPRSMLVDEAIALALESRWEEALALNQQILERHGADEDTHNRIGKALFELGRLDEALASYSEALKLNPLNLIAQKNTRKISGLLETRERLGGTAGAIDVDLFAEEPGKSALTVLEAPADTTALGLVAGDSLELRPDDGVLRVETARGAAVGDIEPKLARRLVPLMRTGNRYTAAVARIDEGRIEIMVREVFQSPENAHKSSFPISRAARGVDYRPYAKDTLLAGREPEVIEETDEEGVEEAGESEDELAGMQRLEGDLDEPSGLDEDDKETSEDARPEDEY